MTDRNEKIIRNVKACLAIEGLHLTEEDIENCQNIVCGKVTADELVQKCIQDSLKYHG